MEGLIKEIKLELREVKVMVEAKKYNIALACCNQVRILTTSLMGIIAERRQANGKGKQENSRHKAGKSQA